MGRHKSKLPKRAPKSPPVSKSGIQLFLLAFVAAGIGFLVWSQFNQTAPRPRASGANLKTSSAPAIVSLPLTNAPTAQTNFEALLPNDPVQLINYGNELLKMNEFAKAVQLYTKALEINPEDEEGHFGLAVAYGRMGRTNEAVKHYEDALKIFPDYSEAHNNLGNIYLAQRQSAKAVQHYLSAIKVQPEYTSAINNLGLALAQQGKTEEALHHFEEAVNLDTNYFEARFNLASALVKLGRSADAAVEFKEVLRQNPGFTPAQQMLARLQQNQSTNKP